MKKPHEQEWHTGQKAGESACAVFDPDGRLMADCRIRYDVADEAVRARFIAVAPKMARALAATLAHLHGTPTDVLALRATIGAILKEAGVLE